MKVFISYSRIDASETAKAIHNYLTQIGSHEVFLDTSDIRGGDEWWKIIQNEISTCDIFVIIVTRAALRRPEVKKEVELAKNLKKRIIPCIAKKYIRNIDLLDLNIYQCIEYENFDQLIQELGYMLESIEKYQRKQSDPKSVLEKQNFEDIKTITSIKKTENKSSRKDNLQYGITIISIILMINGLILFLNSLIIFESVSSTGELGFIILSSLAFVALGITNLVGSWSLSARKGWARTYTLIISFITVMCTIIFLVNSRNLLVIIDIIIFGIIIYYMFTKKVKLFFSKVKDSTT